MRIAVLLADTIKSAIESYSRQSPALSTQLDKTAWSCRVPGRRNLSNDHGRHSANLTDVLFFSG